MLVWCLHPRQLSTLGASLHLGGDQCTLMGASASAVPRLRAWGTTSPLNLEEPYWKWSGSECG